MLKCMSQSDTANSKVIYKYTVLYIAPHKQNALKHKIKFCVLAHAYMQVW